LNFTLIKEKTREKRRRRARSQGPGERGRAGRENSVTLCNVRRFASAPTRWFDYDVQGGTSLKIFMSHRKRSHHVVDIDCLTQSRRSKAHKVLLWTTPNTRGPQLGDGGAHTVGLGNDSRLGSEAKLSAACPVSVALGIRIVWTVVVKSQQIVSALPHGERSDDMAISTLVGNSNRGHMEWMHDRPHDTIAGVRPSLD